MQSSSAPSKLVLPFAQGSSLRNTIPVASQIGITAGAASYTDGFPPLTMTPLASGGVPPAGQDFNGILYALSALGVWFSIGGGFVFDSTEASNTNIAGYPKGARVMRSDGSGYWLNTVDGNTTDPESTTAGASASAGWVPADLYGSKSVAMSSTNITLTPVQYGKPIIILTGTLTANINLILPNLAGAWIVKNECTGSYTITCKTAAGTGVVTSPGDQVYMFGDGTNIYAASPQHNMQAFFYATSTGTLGTLTPTAGVYSNVTFPASLVKVKVWGGGGGAAPADSTGKGGGGSAGGYAEGNVQITGSVTVTVGVGGAIYTAGGTSSFGPILSATGGIGCLKDDVPGEGGMGFGGTINLKGGRGTDLGVVPSGTQTGAPGGAAPCGGAGGAGPAGSDSPYVNSAVAFNGCVPGGGGGTSYFNTGSFDSVSAGAGAPGLVVVEW